MIQELYSMTLPKEKKKIPLYYRYKGIIKRKENALFFLSKNSELELSTYFNSFSLKKWKLYTTLRKIFFKGNVNGSFQLEVYGVYENNNKLIKSYFVTNNFEISFDIEDLSYDIVYIKFIAIKSQSILYSFSYYGSFDSWKNKNINGVICTYCREKYVQKNINKLKKFRMNEPWFLLTVIDNGKTLHERDEDGFQVIHNINYGGSAGFTRGIIECLKKSFIDYVLLMDDDIEFDVMALKKTHAVLCGLKTSFEESFLAGAMLNMESPCIQHENVAYWKILKGISFGHNLDLSKKDLLNINEEKKNKNNQYAAWWYCCIPIKRIKQIGLPLPIFIKGDDLEYSIRNAREIMNMNGIAVWHEEFKKKDSLWVQYLANRNMLMMNFFVKRGTKSELILAIIMRFLKQIISLRKSSLLAFSYSLSDLIQGFSYITLHNNKAYFDTINSNAHKESIIKILCTIIKNSLFILNNYNSIRHGYLKFRDENLKNSNFWKLYLKIK